MKLRDDSWHLRSLLGFLAFYKVPLLLALVLLLQGGLLGLSDDEAYYWVLAQKLDFGYAYHPPATAWIIAFFEGIMAPFLAVPHSFVVRMPAALGASLLIALAYQILRDWGMDPKHNDRA